MRYIKPIVIMIVFLSFILGSTRIAYLRPGPMMKIPYTTPGPSPYLFTAGFATEIHNLSPFNTARGAYGTMELITIDRAVDEIYNLCDYDGKLKIIKIDGEKISAELLYNIYKKMGILNA